MGNFDKYLSRGNINGMSYDEMDKEDPDENDKSRAKDVREDKIESLAEVIKDELGDDVHAFGGELLGKIEDLLDQRGEEDSSLAKAILKKIKEK